MKILTSIQLHELDEYTIEHEPIKSIDLMERAAKAISRAISERWNVRTPIVTFAGPGNNGGDALAVSRMLAEQGYNVTVYLFNTKDHLSEDCAINRDRLTSRVNKFTEVTRGEFELPTLTAETLVIDGLFGSGLMKPLSGGFASLVKFINQTPSTVVSIDVPSGLLCEDNSNNIHSNIIRADLTLTLHQKKLAFLFADNQQYVGKVKVLDIGLSKEFIEQTNTEYTILEEQDVRKLMQPRDDFAHKGSMGSALLVAGSYGMAGAAILAARACTRSGVGKVTVQIPSNNYAVMQMSVPEALVQIGSDPNYFAESVDSEPFDALGIGPGLGQSENTAIALIGQLRRTRSAIVVDADALNILASHRAWMQQLPKEIIMTPHPKEMERLDGNRYNTDYELFIKARELAAHLKAYIILKGHYSALCLPDGNVVFNSTGNSGMATGGCGDVLTGLITGLLARGYSQADACKIGMYLHGLAGDLAIADIGKESLVAGDLITYLPTAFKMLGG